LPEDVLTLCFAKNMQNTLLTISAKYHLNQLTPKP